jgi:hypothetical protein
MSRPTAHVIFSVQLDRSVAALSEAYSRWIEKVILGLVAVGVQPTRAVMLAMDEHGSAPTVLAAWACDLGGFSILPSQVLEYYATHPLPVGAANGCAVDPLIAAGADATKLVTSYPPALGGESGRQIFGARADSLVVVHIDSIHRSAGFSDSVCASAATIAQKDATGHAPWWSYAGGETLPFDRIFHWFIATDEGIDRMTFVNRCRSVQGFPTEVLDVLEPSAQSLFEPLASAINASSGGLATFTPMCDVLSSMAEKPVFESELVSIGSALGGRVIPQLLDQVLSSDNPLMGFTVSGNPGASSDGGPSTGADVPGG